MTSKRYQRVLRRARIKGPFVIPPSHCGAVGGF
jgi:hypothetical protein